MKALILAAGFGVRLREIFHGRPKHLVPVGGRPFLHHLISLLRRNGIGEIVIAVGYLSEQIIREVGDGRKLGVKLWYSVDDRPLGTAGTVKHAERFFESDFLVVNGDTYLDVDYGRVQEFHKKNKADVTIVVTTRLKDEGGFINSRGNRFVGFVEGRGAKFVSNAGVYVFSPRVLRYLKRGERASLENDFFPELVRRKKKVLIFKTQREYFDVGSPEHYEEARKRVREI